MCNSFGLEEWQRSITEFAYVGRVKDRWPRLSLAGLGSDEGE